MIGAAETSRNDKLRVAWERLGNTRARRTNGAAETTRTTNYELPGTYWATRAPVVQTLQMARQTYGHLHGIENILLLSIVQYYVLLKFKHCYLLFDNYPGTGERPNELVGP